VDELRPMSIVVIRRIVVIAGLALLLLPWPSIAEQAKTTAETEAVESAESAESPTAQGATSAPTAEPIAASQSESNAPEIANSGPTEPDEPVESATERPLPVTPATKDWSDRVDDIATQIQMGMSEPEAADALYHELAAALWAYQDEVYEAMRDQSPDALKKRRILSEIYDARMRLLEWVTPELRATMIGGGSSGMREIEREYFNAKLHFYFQALAIPRGLRRIAEDVRESPLDDLWRLMELIFIVVIFRAWRRWAKNGIADARTHILEIQPRTNVHLHAARLLWYLHRFRGPLEWLTFFFIISAIYEPGDLEEVTTLVWVVILWLLLTRFGLLLVDAIASHSVDGPASENAALRLRSLRLITAWILFTGLSLDLSSRYVGEGAIYAWISRAFTLLLGPVLLLLLYWWRDEILRRLGEESHHSSTARRLARQKKGFGSYVNAAAGGIHLTGALLLQLSVRVLSGFDGGRKMVAMLLRREIERDGHRESLSEKRISEELALQLLTPDDTVIDGPFHDGLLRIEALAKADRGAAVAVLAERGGGMSAFLRLLQKDLGDSMRIVDCPPGGTKGFREALADAFGLNHTADLSVELRPRLDELGVRVIAVDNFHRVARPMMGGLAGLDEAARISRGAGEDILWVIAVTRAAWPYISRIRGDGAVLQEVLELPSWSDSQLEELFEARCKAAGIEPDYRRLVFPRQFDDGERATLEERNRFGFRRVLWELSDGNPEVAIRLFCDSLRELPSGKLIVRLPQLASRSEVANSNLTTLLTLRCLIECEFATIDDLAASLQVPRRTVSNAIAYCLQEGWVEEVYDHYQITWDWYRTIKRVLIRRNLITR
jgi:hypothetical protein